MWLAVICLIVAKWVILTEVYTNRQQSYNSTLFQIFFSHISETNLYFQRSTVAASVISSSDVFRCCLQVDSVFMPLLSTLMAPGKFVFPTHLWSRDAEIFWVGWETQVIPSFGLANTLMWNLEFLPPFTANVKLKFSFALVPFHHCANVMLFSTTKNIYCEECLNT